MGLYLGEEKIPSFAVSVFGVSSVNGQTGEVTGLATEAYVDSAISSISTPDMSSKQDKLTGTEGQVVVFDAEGNAIATDDYKNAILLDDGALKNFSGEDITEDIKAIVAPTITGNVGDFVIIGEDGKLTAKTIIAAEEVSF